MNKQLFETIKQHLLLGTDNYSAEEFHTHFLNCAKKISDDKGPEKELGKLALFVLTRLMVLNCLNLMAPDGGAKTKYIDLRDENLWDLNLRELLLRIETGDPALQQFNKQFASLLNKNNDTIGGDFIDKNVVDTFLAK